jgi:peptide/nickel transport system permease protein
MFMAESALPVSQTRASPITIASLLSRIGRSFLFRSLLQAVFTIWLTTTATFILVRLLPSNPIDLYVQQLQERFDMTREDAVARAAAMFISADLDRPVHEQYIKYITSLLRLDLGESIKSTGVKVTEIIAAFLPWTLFCVGTALLISFTFGIMMAYWRNTLFDNVLTTICSYLNSIPNYVIAIMVLLIGAVNLGLFSVAGTRGAYDLNIAPGFTVEFIASILQRAALPITTYVLSTVGGWALSMKNSTLGVLGEEYVNAAVARGLSPFRILTAYVARNASLPLFTSLALSIGFVVGGSIVIEEYFVYPGIGQRLLTAVRDRDYPVMQGIFLVTAISVIVANLLADFLYSRLDPRVRIEKGS